MAEMLNFVTSTAFYGHEVRLGMTDIEIARAAEMRPITRLASECTGMGADAIDINEVTLVKDGVGLIQDQLHLSV